MSKKRELKILNIISNSAVQTDKHHENRRLNIIENPQSSILNPRSSKTGKAYWRSLEEFAETPEFEQYLHREFPENASEWNDPVGRRKFLKLMGASLALAGLSTACSVQPTEK